MRNAARLAPPRKSSSSSTSISPSTTTATAISSSSPSPSPSASLPSPPPPAPPPAPPSHSSSSSQQQGRRGRGGRGGKGRQRPSISLLSRNVEAVVLGDVLFQTWYYSPYPDSVLFSAGLGSGSGFVAPVGENGGTTKINSNHNTAAAAADAADATPASMSVLCPVLHVCPYCFRYTPHASEYVVHLGLQQQARSRDPELTPVPESATLVYSYDGYCVWEVDGEREKLYCQNLSLFGKLFLEQKSVFFDTGGFLYYVLTYTAPPMASENPASDSSAGKKHTNDAGYMEDGMDVDDNLRVPPSTEVLGFFSKENPSWDSNNLACILIFPPYQHRQLGKLLMSVSYKLSGWEWEGGVIGGPEKPLSRMGRRSYHRFWSERVARFILGETADADGRKVLEGEVTRKKRKNATAMKEALTVREIGERTGMLAEDVMAALTEMDVCELVTSPHKPRVKKDGEANVKTGGERSGGGRAATAGTGTGTRTGAGAGKATQEEDAAAILVKRSRVIDWVREKRVDLHDPVREEGFLGEWAMSETNTDETETIDVEY